ncbi:MAG: transcriptional repressor [Desulfuromonas sp.]|nr:MAG: transcriptional repressor [Desulfuromonas sp.]
MAHNIENILDLFQQACREKNLRVTPQRVEIFRELALAQDHPSAEALYRRLADRMPMLSLDTVYRTLGTFCELGLISKVDTVESQARYEVALKSHHHLICERCGKIIDFDWQQIDGIDLPEEVRGMGHFKTRNVVVYGVCNDCLKTN